MKILYRIFLMAIFQMGTQNAFSYEKALHLYECYESQSFDKKNYGPLEITPKEYAIIQDNFPTIIPRVKNEYSDALSDKATQLCYIGFLLSDKLGAKFTPTSTPSNQVHYILGIMVKLMEEARPGSTMHI